MSSPHREASCKLDFLVIGASVAGLGAAYTLARAGHRVRVLERRDSLAAPSGGVRVPPNMSKMLKRWAGQQRLDKVSLLNIGTPWFDLETAEPMSYSEWDQSVMREFGGDFLLMKHEDVVQLLYKLATAAGAQITFGATVIAVTPGDSSPSVTLASGSTFTADLVVAADGSNSFVRNSLFGQQELPKPSKISSLATTIQAGTWEGVPEFKPLNEINGWSFGLATDRACSAHPTIAPKSRSVAVHLYWPDTELRPDRKYANDWTDVLVTKDMSLGPCHPTFQKFWERATYWRQGHIMDWPSHLDYRVDDTRRILLIGEAAHGFFTGGLHGAAQAVEDAAVLGNLFSRIRLREQIDMLVDGYEEIRRERGMLVGAMDIENAKVVVNPGPNRWPDGASSKPKSSADKSGEESESQRQKEFEQAAPLFCYDCDDVVDEWWLNWGVHMDPGRSTNPDFKKPLFSNAETIAIHAI